MGPSGEGTPRFPTVRATGPRPPTSRLGLLRCCRRRRCFPSGERISGSDHARGSESLRASHCGGVARRRPCGPSAARRAPPPPKRGPRWAHPEPGRPSHRAQGRLRRLAGDPAPPPRPTEVFTARQEGGGRIVHGPWATTPRSPCPQLCWAGSLGAVVQEHPGPHLGCPLSPFAAPPGPARGTGSAGGEPRPHASRPPLLRCLPRRTGAETEERRLPRDPA